MNPEPRLSAVAETQNPQTSNPMPNYNWYTIIQQIKSSYKIIAFDKVEGEPYRLYLSLVNETLGEATKGILVDIKNRDVFPPQYLGSYTARWCPVTDIRILQTDHEKFWKKILEFEDESLLLLHWFTTAPWDRIDSIPSFDALRIKDFMPYIRVIPFQYQSFDIKRAYWNDIVSKHTLNLIFESEDENAVTTISRNDLFNHRGNTESFLIKVLMWGYPTKGRGNHIVDFLENKNNFSNYVQNFENAIRQNSINENTLSVLFKTKGLKLSTVSKFLYFKKVKMNGNPTLILDQKVINALTSKRFSDRFLSRFQGLKYENAIDYYPIYINLLSELAYRYHVQPDQIELFLFTHGSNLKKNSTHYQD